MLEVGEYYEIRMLEDGHEVSFEGKIEKYEHPLVKLADREHEVTIRRFASDGSDKTIRLQSTGRIINVTSPNFIGANKKKSGGAD